MPQVAAAWSVLRQARLQTPSRLTELLRATATPRCLERSPRPGNGVFSNYLYVGTGATNVAINSSAISLAAGNILINTSTITIGIGSTNNSINATNYSGTANNSTNFASQPQSFYANVTSPIFSANITIGSPTVNTIINSTALVMGNVALNTISMGVGANVFMNTSVFIIGGTNVVNTFQNSSTTTIGQSVINTTTMSVAGNVIINSTAITIGNTMSNVIINSTAITGVTISGSITSALTANDTTYFNHQLPSYYANVTSPNFSANITVGGSVTNVTINATSFTGQANDALNFNSQPPSFYANVTSPMINVITVGNSLSNALINSTAYAGSANNATWFAGQPQQFYANVTSPVFTSNITIGTGPSVVITPTTITGVSILQANNATNFAGQPQSFYANVSNPVVVNSLTVGNAQAFSTLYPTNLIMGYFTVNVGATQAQLTIGNAQVNTFVNSTSLVMGTTLVNSTVISSGLNTAMTVSGFAVGNSSINTTINSVSVAIGNSTTNSLLTTLNWYIGNVVANTQINSTSITVSQAFLTNTTYSQVLGGFRLGGIGVNLAGLSATQIGSTYNINVGAPSLFGYNWSGGSGGLGELDLFVNRGTGSSGGVYVYDYLNNVATIMFSANATGIYTGVVNGTSHTIGTSFTVNTTAINIGSLTLIANTTQGGAGQILTSNSIGGTYWGSAQGGTVTSVATGNGMAGGTFTTSGTVYATAGPGIIVNTQGICVQANTGLVVNSAGLFVNTAGYAVLASSPTFTGNVTAVDFYATSDIAYKEDLQRLENVIDKISTLIGYSYTHKLAKSKKIGLVAQDVEKVFPETVGKNEDGFLQLSYGGIVAVLVEAVKELSLRLKKLEEK